MVNAYGYDLKCDMLNNGKYNCQAHFIQKMHGKQHNTLRVSELMDWAAQQYGFKEIGTAEVRYSAGSL